VNDPSARKEDLAREIDRSRAELARQAERVEAQRKRLIAATQEKEITEKLRERSWADYQAAERKSEESFIEEYLANRTAQARL
jgi:flagellar biosynthesis chaperone FliJ